MKCISNFLPEGRRDRCPALWTANYTKKGPADFPAGPSSFWIVKIWWDMKPDPSSSP